MRRRRRARPLWFPPLGAVLTNTEGGVFIGGTTFEIPVDASGAIETRFLPLTFDEGQENILAQSADSFLTLADIMSSAWRLRRAITNVFATYGLVGVGAEDVAPNAPPGCVFGFGLMVLATDASGAPTATTLPSVFNRDDYTDPWICRRVWILGQGQRPLRKETGTVGDFRPVGGAIGEPDSAFANFPTCNTEYGYVAGGPYIDQKTNRVIGPEERLFAIFATKSMPLNTAFNQDAFVAGYWDYRLLGGLQRSSNRRNASR